MNWQNKQPEEGQKDFSHDYHPDDLARQTLSISGERAQDRRGTVRLARRSLGCLIRQAIFQTAG